MSIFNFLLVYTYRHPSKAGKTASMAMVITQKADSENKTLLGQLSH